MILGIVLSACSGYNRGLKDAQTVGRYKVDYRKLPTIPNDTVIVEIVLFDVKTNKPIGFYKPKFSLNEHVNKVIEGNKCTAFFSKDELPKNIFLELHHLNKHPMNIFIDKSRSKKFNYVFVTIYLAEDSRAIL